MLLGILQTGRVLDSLVGEHGEYPEMFEALYRAADPDVALKTWAVVDGVLPDRPTACDAWLVTGSKFGVYDAEPWIPPLKDFLRAARQARVPMIGVCFGHQLMAEAFGGRAEKSEKGWGCGVHDYGADRVPGWMQPSDSSFAMHAMHQDQVTAIPADATRLASSPFCEYAMLSYGDPEAPDAISIQPHPEFGEDYARDLVEARKGSLIPDERADAALQTFGAPVDGLAFARWSLAYVRLMLARQRAA